MSSALFVLVYMKVIFLHALRKIFHSEFPEIGISRIIFHPGEPYLRRLCRYISEGCILELAAAFRVNYKDRSLLVESDAITRGLTAKISVTQRFWIRLVHQTEEPENEIIVGDSVIDDLYFIHSDFPEAVQHFFQNADVRRILPTLHGFSRIEFSRMASSSIFDPAAKKLKPGQFENLLSSLVHLAVFYEGQNLPLKISRPAEQIHTICPYCRNSFSFKAEA